MRARGSATPSCGGGPIGPTAGWPRRVELVHLVAREGVGRGLGHGDPLALTPVVDLGPVRPGADGDIDEHLRVYANRRDETVMPMYEFTLQMAALEPPPDLAALLEALRGQPEHINRFLGVLAATVPVTEFMAPQNLERILSRS